MQSVARDHRSTAQFTARTAGLRRLTTRLDALVAGESDPHVIAGRTGLLLRAALPDEALLEAPEGLYSVVALVWKPGQATAIHDHRTDARAVA